MLDAQTIRAAIKWAHRYETKDGRVVRAVRVSEFAASMRDAGWRNVPKLDAYDLRKLGLEVVVAQYVNGAHPTGRFIDVLVL